MSGTQNCVCDNRNNFSHIQDFSEEFLIILFFKINPTKLIMFSKKQNNGKIIQIRSRSLLGSVANGFSP
jgi:hypothetical protein